MGEVNERFIASLSKELSDKHIKCEVIGVNEISLDTTEHDKQIRADAIDDVLFYLYDKNYINSDDEAYFREQLKEQK